MNMELIKKIESNIKELEDRARKNGDFIVNANSSIEKLNAEKTTITDETNRIMGALQAFRFILSEKDVNCDKGASSEESLNTDGDGTTAVNPA